MNYEDKISYGSSPPCSFECTELMDAYIFTHTYKYIRAYTCIYTWISMRESAWAALSALNSYMLAHLHIFTHAEMHLCTHIHLGFHESASINSFECLELVRACTSTHTYTHASIHLCNHMYLERHEGVGVGSFEGCYLLL